MKLRSLFFTAAMIASSPAQAAYVIDIDQAGANVMMTGNGSLNLSGLSLYGSTFGVSPFVSPDSATLVLGQFGNLDIYQIINGPLEFSNGFSTTTYASSATGPLVGLTAQLLLVKQGYVSGSSFSSSATYNGKSLAGLGLETGVYTWNWGQGATADSFTVRIGQASAVPEPGTWAMMLFGFGLLGAAMRYRRRSKASVNLAQ